VGGCLGRLRGESCPERCLAPTPRWRHASLRMPGFRGSGSSTLKVPVGEWKEESPAVVPPVPQNLLPGACGPANARPLAYERSSGLCLHAEHQHPTSPLSSAPATPTG